MLPLPNGGRAGRRARIVVAVLAGLGFSSLLAADEPPSLRVFAAASLSEVFSELGKMMEQRNPSARVVFNFAGSQQLAAQIEQGAHADVFASADVGWMNDVQGRGLLAGRPQVFARNRLVVVVPKRNPGQIERLQDLARSGVKVVMASEAVPVGRYSREVFDNLSRDEGFGVEFSAGVLRNVVSQEENVKAVLAKVQLGEADAGLVYRSDVTGAVAASVQVLDIPAPFNVEARYPIAIIKGTPNASLAQTFVDLVRSPEGQRVLERYDFVPVQGR